MNIAKPLPRLALFFLIAAVIAALSYRFFYPGYLNPFAIYHIDHFVYMGMSAHGYGVLVYFEKFPRPIAHVLIDLCGRLGPHGLLAPIFIVSLINIGLVALYVERLLQRNIALPAFALFAALAYGNPEFYVHLKADPFAAFALLFLLLTFHCWQNYVESAKPLWLGLIAALVVLLCLTKESYFPTVALFFLLQIFVSNRNRVAAAAMLLFSGANIGYALHRASTKWTLFQRRPLPSDPYWTDLSLHSLLHGLLVIGRGVLHPVIVLSLIMILVAAWFRYRTGLYIALAALALGVASWLPNATLPNHWELQYSCLALLFLLSPFLLVPFLIPKDRGWTLAAAATAMLVYALSLDAYTRIVRGEAGWIRAQEVSAMRLLDEMTQMKRTAKAGDSSLVSGLDLTYNPFAAPSYIFGYFGHDRFWTVIVPDAVPEHSEDTTRLIHASNPLRLQPYARWFVFDHDRLTKVIDHPTTLAIAPELNEDQVKVQLAAASAVAVPGRLSFYASPDPVPAGNSQHAHTTIHWSSLAKSVQVRIGSPDGRVFAGGGPTGEATTGEWLTGEMVFYLQDASSGDASSARATLAKLQVRFAK